MSCCGQFEFSLLCNLPNIDTIYICKKLHSSNVAVTLTKGQDKTTEVVWMYAYKFQEVSRKFCGLCAVKLQNAMPESILVSIAGKGNLF